MSQITFSKGVLKKIFSYIFPITLYRYKQPGQKTIRLQLFRGQYQLAYGWVYYSDGKAYFPFRRTLSHIGDPVKRVDQTLVLGTGIGSVGMILTDLFPQQKFTIHYVDIHPIILKMCERVMSEYSNISPYYYQEDAVLFVQKETRAFDLICIDVFDEHIVPKQIFSEGFILNIKRIMSEKAYVIFNTMFLSKLQQHQFETIINEYFDYVHTIDTSRNILYILSLPKENK